MIAGSCFLLGACAPSSPGSPTPIDRTQIHSIPSGPLELIYEKIAEEELKQSFFIHACDVRLEATKKRLARFVDQNLKSVSSAMDVAPEDSRTQLESGRGIEERAQSTSSFQLGDILVRPRVPVDSSVAEWLISRSDSWEKIDSYRGYVEALVADKDYASARVFLKAMDNKIRSLAPDEERRRVFGLSYRLDAETLPDFKELQRTIKACLVDSACVAAEFSAQLSSGSRSILNETPVFSELHDWIKKAKDPDEERVRLANLAQWVDNELDYYTSKKTPAVQRLGPGRFELALNAGPLASFEKQVADFIAELWSGNGRSLKISWTPERDPLGSLLPYSINVLSTQGRGYVSHHDREIVLPKAIHYGTLHHEIGHVLGLPDTYYTRFDPTTCTYVQKARPRDVMSSSASGAVLDTHWSELDVLYAP